MHLKNEDSELFPQVKKRQSTTQTSSVAQTNQNDDYACGQEATDILNGKFSKNQMKIREEEPSLVDYVDQFLWNCPESEETPMFQMHGPPSTLLQTQKLIPFVQPSPLQIYNPFKIELLSQALPKKPDESSNLSKDYKKNLAGYIIKKVIRIILSPSFSNRLLKLCQRSSVALSTVREYLESCLPAIFGPNSIHELFFIRTENERKMKEMLLALIQRTLRKRYTVEILKEGRMRDYDSYVGVKNRGLLYFSQLLTD